MPNGTDTAVYKIKILFTSMENGEACDTLQAK